MATRAARLSLGRYELFTEIASGGMGTVHLARVRGAEGFSKTVAVKRMHRHLAADRDFAAMFIDEARIASRLQHPNIVSTMDIVAEDGELFLVMEYVAGETFSELLKRASASGKRCPPRIAAAIVCGTLRGIQHAHDARAPNGESLALVHRDVSPHNILVGVDGIPRLMDFGIAKAAGRLHETRGTEVKGKLPYMAPETLESGLVDARVDTYAAAVCFWESLAGRRLFRGETDAEVWADVVRHQIPLVSDVVPGLSRFDEILRRGMARDPAKRYASAEELALAIEQTGVASPSEVRRWVETVAAARLAARAELVAEVENASFSAADDPPAASVPPDVPQSRASRQRVIVIAALAAAAAIVALAAMKTVPRATVAAPVASLASAPPSEPSVALPSTSTSAATAPPAPETASSSRPPRASGTTKTRPPPALTPGGCDPPYILEPSGRRTYKKECLRAP